MGNIFEKYQTNGLLALHPFEFFMSTLLQKKCVPCEGGTPLIDEETARRLLSEIPKWMLRDKKLTRGFRFKDFKETIAFVVQVAMLAETEGHHPDMGVHWGRVEIELWTHAIGGLSENDFILAAKINALSTSSSAASAKGKAAHVS